MYIWFSHEVPHCRQVMISDFLSHFVVFHTKERNYISALQNFSSQIKFILGNSWAFPMESFSDFFFRLHGEDCVKNVQWFSPQRRKNRRGNFEAPQIRYKFLLFDHAYAYFLGGKLERVPKLLSSISMYLNWEPEEKVCLIMRYGNQVLIVRCIVLL